MLQHTLEVTTEKEGGVDVVTLSGALESSTLATFQKAMDPLLAHPGARIVIDCFTLSYVNSTCFALLNKYSGVAAKNGGRMVFCRFGEKIMGIVKLLGLHHSLKICDTREEAVAAAQAG